MPQFYQQLAVDRLLKRQFPGKSGVNYPPDERSQNSQKYDGRRGQLYPIAACK